MLILMLAGFIALIYGATIAFSAIKAMRQEKLSSSAAAAMGFTGLVIMFSALFIPFKIQPAFYALLVGIIAMHALAIKKEKDTHGEFSPKNHLMQIIISLVVVGLTFIGIFLS